MAPGPILDPSCSFSELLPTSFTGVVLPYGELTCCWAPFVDCLVLGDELLGVVPDLCVNTATKITPTIATPAKIARQFSRPAAFFFSATNGCLGSALGACSPSLPASGAKVG